MNWNWRRRLFGDPETCRCSHAAEWHRHLHDRGYCGTCGPRSLDNPAGCSRFRRRRGEPVDLTAVCRDDQVIDAVNRGDLNAAREIAGDEFVVELVAAIHATGGHA